MPACLSPGEGFLGVDVPVDFAQWGEERFEVIPNRQGLIAEELKLSSQMQLA